MGRSAQLQITHYTTHTVNQQKNFPYFWWLIDVSNYYLANQRFLGRSSQNVVKIELKRTSWSGLDLCKRWPGSVRIHTSCRATPPSRMFILIPRGKKIRMRIEMKLKFFPDLYTFCKSSQKKNINVQLQMNSFSKAQIGSYQSE